MSSTNQFPIPQITSAAQAEAVAVQAVTEEVRVACADPADAIRLLSALAVYAPAGAFGSDAIGNDMEAMETATSAMCRRAALTSLALASSTYNPTSYQDAITIRTNVCALLDAEILTAGDAGDFATYSALRTLRSAVSADLTTRAASLAVVVQVNFRAALPALVEAYYLYQDASRSDDLITRANPVSPLFMPLSYEALAS